MKVITTRLRLAHRMDAFTNDSTDITEYTDMKYVYRIYRHEVQNIQT